MIEKLFADDKVNANAFIIKAENYISKKLDRELLMEDERADVVRLMNVHKAKGFQGNIVIMVNKVNKDRRTGEIIDVSIDAADESGSDFRKENTYFPLIKWGYEGGRGSADIYKCSCK